MVVLHLNIKAGMAMSGPPLGPTLGQYGIAIGPFCDSFNEQTILFKNSYPLNVYLYLNKDGSYNYYIYFPRLVFFLRKLLKKEEGPANVPRYYYFLGYILVKMSDVNNTNINTSKLLWQKINEVFNDQSLEIEKIDLYCKYKNVLSKGSFRSITSELLFESVIFSNMSILDIKGLFNYFYELRDYFIIDYVPFFFFLDYIKIYSEILYRYNFDNLDSVVINVEDEDLFYNIHIPFSKYNNLLKTIELMPTSIYFYSAYYELGDLINNEEFFIYYIYYIAEVLEVFSGENDFSISLKNCFIGFNFNYSSFIRGSNFIENSLVFLDDFFVQYYKIRVRKFFNLHYFTDNYYIFMFTMYVSVLYFSQYEYYTDYDFREISKCQNRFKQMLNSLEQHGICLMTRYSHEVNSNIFYKQYLDVNVRC